MIISFVENFSPILCLSLWKRREIRNNSQERQSEGILNLSLHRPLKRIAEILTAMVPKTVL